MSTDAKPEGAGRGLGEVSQDAIEEEALKIAQAQGRETMDESDIAKAREQILGKSSSTKAPEKTQKAEG